MKIGAFSQPIPDPQFLHGTSCGDTVQLMVQDPSKQVALLPVWISAGDKGFTDGGQLFR